jgi:hypothetical protein
MTIRRLTYDDAENVVSVFLKHTKFQNMPKSVTMASIHDTEAESEMTLFDRIMSRDLPEDMKDPDAYWFGNFNNSGILTAYVRFKFWLDDEVNENCWTMGLMCRNKDITPLYTYGQSKIPDDIIDIINYAIDIAEKQNMRIGYSLVQDAVPDTHQNAWLRIVDTVDSSRLKISKDKYKHEVVENIPAGEFSKVAKFRAHVHRTRYSIRQKIVKMTKI